MIGFQAFEVLFFLAYFLVFGIILVTIIRQITQWSKNNHSPKLTVSAVVVAKRGQVSRHHSGTGMHRSYTSYYATFQVECGDRMELALTGQEYGLLVEGDRGKLTFQGTRFLGFERT